MADCRAPKNYEILEVLVKGSKSTVYAAKSKRGRLRGRHLALKIVNECICISFRFTDVFKTADALGGDESNRCWEATTAIHKGLHHPSIVSLLSAFHADGMRVHVLELCAGGTLAEYARAKSVSFSEAALRFVLGGIVDALRFLHKQRIAHGAVCEQNVLIGEGNRVVRLHF